MAKEIEVKKVFALNAERLAIIQTTAFAELIVEQGYLVIDDNVEVRIRRQIKNDEVNYLMTVKEGNGLVRSEIEFAIEGEMFIALWPLTEECRVEKTRYQIAIDGGLVAEVDIYHGMLSGHASVEVEFPDEQTVNTLVLPAFFGDTQDVTMDKRYKNQSLAVYGWPTNTLVGG